MAAEGPVDKPPPRLPPDRPPDYAAVNDPVVDSREQVARSADIAAAALKYLAVNKSITDNRQSTIPEVKQAAEDAIRDIKEASGRWIGEQGAAGEAARRKTLSHDGIEVSNLNDLSKNFPLLDNTNAERFESVKVRAVEYALRTRDLSAYRNDLLKIVDPGRVELREKAADLLSRPDDGVQGLRASDAWPTDLAQSASSADVADYIRNSAILAVPSDHVDALRDYVAEDAVRLPEKYGLTEQYTAEDIDRLRSRVQSIGISAGEIDGLQILYGTDTSAYRPRN